MRRLYNRIATDVGARVTEKLFFGLTMGLIAACLPMWSCTLIADFSGPGGDKPDAAFDAATDTDAAPDLDATTDPDAITDPDATTDPDSTTTSDGETEEDAGDLCGNGAIDEGEDCDGDNLGGETCLTLGHGGGGELSCTDECKFHILCDNVDLSCMGVGLCYECCVWEDTPCHDACEQAGDSFSGVYSCLESNCSNECNNILWSSACYDCENAVPSCYNDCKWNFDGSTNCSEVYECLKSCSPLLRGGDESSCPGNNGIHCFDGCVRTMDSNSTGVLFDLLDCMKMNCPGECSEFGSEECQDCLTDNCNEKKEICENHTQ